MAEDLFPELATKPQSAQLIPEPKPEPKPKPRPKSIAKADKPKESKPATSKVAEAVDAPAGDETVSSELGAMEEKLRGEISQLDTQISAGRAPVGRATIKERELLGFDIDAAKAKKRAKNEELRKIIKLQKEAEKVGPVADSDPAMVSNVVDTNFGDLSGPVYPTRGFTRADEKLREAESRVYTAPQMYADTAQEFSTMSPRKREVDLATSAGFDPVTGESIPNETRRYASSRKREDLKRALGLIGQPSDPTLLESIRLGATPGLVRAGQRYASTAVDRTLGPAIDLVTGGPIRSLARSAGQDVAPALTSIDDPRRYTDYETGEQKFVAQQNVTPGSPLAPRQGGRMFAPRGDVNEGTAKKVSRAIIERKLQIQGAEDRIKEVRENIRRGTISKLEQPSAYAEIAFLNDDIEQLRAEELQLMRIQRITIPRERAEEQARAMAGSGIVEPE